MDALLLGIGRSQDRSWRGPREDGTTRLSGFLLDLYRFHAKYTLIMLLNKKKTFSSCSQFSLSMLSLRSILCEQEIVSLVLLASITILDKDQEEEEEEILLLVLSHLITWDSHYVRFVLSLSLVYNV